jgi:polyisoprenoid-binding protein YceI
MSTTATLVNTVWRVDPASFHVEFYVKHFWGLGTVKGHFNRFQGTLGPSGAELTIDADSLDTNNPKRDKHLRSKDFFDVEQHPYIRFVSQSVGDQSVTGVLYARGASVALEIPVSVRRGGEELEFEAVTTLDQRELGITFSPLGVVRTPSRLVVRGRLVREGA